MSTLYEELYNRIRAGLPVAYGVIISTSGSSPQVPGASALIIPSGLLYGTLGGGPLEAAAIEKAILCLQSCASELMTHSMLGNGIDDMESICGGEARVLIDAVPDLHRKEFKSLLESLEKRKPGVLLTSFQAAKTGPPVIQRQWIKKQEIFGAESERNPIPFRDEAKEAFTAEKPILVRKEEEHIFLEPVFPRYRLLIAGAGHIGRAVAHLGHLLNFEVTVIDDRDDFANRERLPEADRIIVEDIGTAFREWPMGDDTFVVIVTRGHSQDSDALKACIKSDAAYIGMIGSARKIAIMRRDFIQKKWASPQELERLYAPIGIDIHSKTIQEIAVSIAAQLVEVRNELQGRRLEER